MFTKLICIAALAISCASAKPGVVAPVAYSAPVVAAGPAFVTAQSSQVVARNYNGIAPLAYTAAVAAPLAYTAPVAKVAAAPLAYSAYAAPYAAPYAAVPYAAAPYAAAAYAAAPYARAFGSPLAYAASPYGAAALRYNPYYL